MKIDIWSDIACPFCYIGLTQLQEAIATFPHADNIDLVHHSFELDPDAPTSPTESMAEMLTRKKGLPAEQLEQMLAHVNASAQESGLSFDMASAKMVTTFHGHQLIHFAAEHNRGMDMSNRLHKAYFSDGLNVADTDTLVKLAGEIGLDEAAARTALDTDRYADAVRADIRLAAAHGISGVPFFIVDEQYGISGAQGVAAFSEALSTIWRKKNPLTMVGSAEATTCQDGVCL